ncbi:MAG: hypothetical protein HKN94_04410 [Acidimicrobiales bacterium]|nr:hypothetical protein [Acidimicrobiales bacterium]RZV45200.1 MAG: hypothetical protein EX269_10500 [Acidimicrobiales bacterium]
MALTKWQPPVIRHSVDDDGHVVWLELYFDLIYVAALIQLGDQLAGDVSWSGVFRFAAIFAVLWWTWTGTTAFMNRFAVDDVVHRLLVFAQMFAVGNLALVAVSPIDDRPRWIALAYVGARIPLLIMYARVRSHARTRGFAQFLLVVFSTGSVIWLLSLLVPTPARYWVWALALVLEFAAPAFGIKRFVPPPAHEEHFRERYALFTIIVLGETFVKTLSEVADIGISLESQVFGGVVFAIGIALWWTYFDDVADSSIRPSERGNLLVPWIYSHLPLAMAITALGVASKKIIGVSSFDAAISDKYLWLLVGSVAVVLVATAALDAVTASPHFAVGLRLRVLPRLVAAGILLLVPVVVGTEPALLVVAIVAIVVVGQIAIQVTAATKVERRVIMAMDEQLAEIEGSCIHLETTPDIIPKSSVCEECERAGHAWVELRVCLTCGDVGCCDDSAGRHATAHYETTGHALIASIEPGAQWAYCYTDDLVKADWRSATERQ